MRNALLFAARLGLIAALAAAAHAEPTASPSTPGPASGLRTLTMQQAIDGALKRNVQTLLADARRDQATGARVQARSAFLPHLSAEASQSRQSNNLAAQGINFDMPGFPSVVTFNRFDARARLRQNLFDYSALQRYKGAKIGERVADEQLAVAREQVAAQAALDYVSALAARQTVAAAQADLDLADRLLELARDQEQIGVGTGVDVTRARSRQARARARLAQARTHRNRSSIELARTTGLPLDPPLKLEDDLVFSQSKPTPVDQALSRALAHRPEIQLAEVQIKRGRKQLAAAKGKRLPTVSVQAAYGDSGNTYHENVEDTYSIGAQVQVPIFSGGAISGRIDSAASTLDQQRINYRDTRNQVSQDVRLARQTLSTQSERVTAARSGLKLARRELTQARDRFAEGVSNNVEVVDAQASLADARNTRVAALADYTRARINLAAALGGAQQFTLHESTTP